MVKLLEVPVRCMVASVWVDQVPKVRIPPPEDASRNAVAGSGMGVYAIQVSPQFSYDTETGKRTPVLPPP
jgi:hypothetical protein